MNLADAILGRRYSWAEAGLPDFTVVSYDPGTDAAGVHIADGRRGNITGAGLAAGLEFGALVEALAAPFELPEPFEQRRSRRGYAVKGRDGRTTLVERLCE